MEINDQYKDQDGTQCWKENKCNLPMDLTWQGSSYVQLCRREPGCTYHATFYSIVHWPGFTSQQKTKVFHH